MSIGTNIAKGQDITLENTIIEVGAGQLGGNMTSKYAKKSMKNTQTIKNLDIDISNKQKLIDSGKTMRKDARQQQKKQLETVRNNKIDSVTTKAGIVGSSSTSATTNEVVNTFSIENKEE